VAAPAADTHHTAAGRDLDGTPRRRETRGEATDPACDSPQSFTGMETMPENDRDRLRQMLLDRSMRFGEFVLSSGATSNYYIDVRKTSLHPEGLKMIARLFWEQLEQDQVTAVGGLTLGADPLVAGVIWWSHEKGKPMEGFLVRKMAKDHGMRGQVEGNLAGHKRIAVLDDVITSGESALIAAEAAESYKAEVVRVLAVVDREQGAAQMFQQRGYPYTSLFSIGDLLPAQK
jgi:orotate phosphoribosyltransferase